MMRATAGSTAPIADQWPDDAFRRKHPTLVEWMSDGRWEDGSARELSSLSLKWQDGMVLAALNDQEGKRTLYKAAVGVPEAILAIEKALSSPNPEWRSWGARTKKK